MRASRSAVAMLLGTLLGADGTAAEPSSTGTEQTPDIALLEYLGSMVDERDRLIGPDDMQRSDVDEPPSVADDDGDEAR